MNPPPEERLAPALGWASLALGVPQVAMPAGFARCIGVRDERDSRGWARVVGVRELAAAAGILALERERPVNWLWARVAGDVMDLTLLARALRDKPPSRARIAAAMGAVAGIAAADAYAATRLSRRPPEEEGTVQDPTTRVRAAITIRRPPEDVYAFWRDFEHLPDFMSHLETVRANGDRLSHWTAKAPAGRTVQWDAEIVEDRPGELIAWRSLPGAEVENSGTVRFTPAPGDRGTEIHLSMAYEPPGGPLGELVARLFGEEPRQQVTDDLRRLKQVMETGVVMRSEATPEGPVTKRLLKQRPARPLAGAVDGGSAS